MDEKEQLKKELADVRKELADARHNYTGSRFRHLFDAFPVYAFFN